MTQAFVNKELVLSFNDTNGVLKFSTNFANFFMDEGANGGEASAGKVDYLRIFDTALTSAEVAALEAPVAPVNDVPEPATAALMLFGVGMLGVARRRKSAA
ncbi:PEP-CTERM sorting domain-containing protein [Massilia cavernae]|uniref:PEP-CTERM sorting domain-containing protein n=2 Tax=Massilia cavernae TaxID=2320864 RepID=A0A418Y645_9BURK|nr:PEP-CTERM sorting domain-containing protein [Massilia cavernae]